MSAEPAPMMELQHGPQAHAQVARMLHEPNTVVALTVDPMARARGGAKIAALALATPHGCAVVEPSRVPGLATFFEQDFIWAADDAKAVHRALLCTLGAAPRRWACVRVTEQLLACGTAAASTAVNSTLPALAAPYGLGPVPQVEHSLAAMAEHARFLLRLVRAQSERLRPLGLMQVSRLEAAAIAPIAEMEHHGMPFDAPQWSRVAAHNEAQLEELRAELLHYFAAHNSGAQAAPTQLDHDHDLRLLLAQAGMPVADVRRERLATLPAPLGDWLPRYRTLLKLVAAYGTAFLQHVGADGRIHPTFVQIGASTGRMACQQPNLQAMVKAGPHRQCFRCAPHRRLVIGDYSQCELRILAELSGDPVFAAAFAAGEDLHATVASYVFGQPVSKETQPHLRERAKAINFGLIYGMGPQGLAKTLQIALPQAQALLKHYFTRFPRIGAYLHDTAAQALARGFACTLSGRRLNLAAAPTAAGAIQQPARQLQAQAERVAKNMPIQGTSADITKIALAQVRRALAPFPTAFLVNSIHDELVVECDATDADTIQAVVRQAMVAAGSALLKQITLTADVAVTSVWSK